MAKRFFLYIALFLLFATWAKRSSGQCLEVLDGFGNLSDNPYFIGCLGTDLTVFIQPNRVVGNYTIDWGDGTIEGGTDITPPANISHTYTATVDTFVITLTEGACVLTGVAVLEQTPAASIELNDPDNFGCAPASFDFENNTTNVSQTTRFTWNFGDGSPIENYDYTNQGQIVSHTYQPMTVNCNTSVTLTAENYCNQGNPSSSVFSPIQVWDIDEAAIDASDMLLCYPDTVVDFTNASILNCNTLAQGNTSQRLEYWNFGDYWGLGYDSIIGWRPRTLAAIPVEYPGVGSYDITLIDSSFCGIDAVTITIQIVPPPFAALMASDDTICEGEAVTFTDLSGGGANTYAWNFDDGTGWNNTGPGNVSNTFNTSGDHTIEFAVGIAGAAGCADTASVDLFVLPSPSSIFSFNDNNGCDTLRTSFTNSSTEIPTDTIDSWQWDFGNTNTSNLENPPDQFYAMPGVYPVELIVSTVKGCEDTMTQTINVYNPPVANFSVASVCENAAANFTDLSTEDPLDVITDWLWDFDDGGNSMQQNPSHTYTSAGNINVQLKINTTYCEDSITIPLTIETLPTALFAPDLTDGCSLLDIAFTNTSLGAVDYKWYFGDGDSSTLANPSHSFDNSLVGMDTTYTTTLIASTLFGCTDTITENITVYPNPVAIFTHDGMVDCAPVIINYTNGSLDAVSYEWDFGDGTPIDNTPNPSHVHENLTQFMQSYVVTLVAITANNCRDSVMTSVTILPEPQFDFSTSPDSGCTPLTINFPAIVGAVDYEWDFGDGNVTTGPTPTNTYTNSTTNNLTFTTRLIGTSAFMCIDTTYADIVVFPKPTAQFNVDTINGCTPIDITYTNTSLDGDIYHWDFDDGTNFDTLAGSFDHIFTNITGIEQRHQSRLISETNNGCMDTAYQEISVYPEVVAAFDSDTAGCHPYAVPFTNFTLGGDTYIWNFGDASLPDSSLHPNHQFVNTTSADTSFVVTLFAQSSFGCADTAYRNIEVFPKPTAQYTVDRTDGCTPISISFTNTSFGGDNYFWNLDDVTNFDTLAGSFDHTYTNLTGIEQKFLSNLIAETNNGCRDTANQEISIYPEVVTSFVSDTAGCSPYNVSFINFSTGGNDYRWDFGDTSSINTEQHPNHIFVNETAGDTNYLVTLIVESSFGCADTSTGSITVYETPVASFVPDPFVQDYPSATVTIDNTSSLGDWDYQWDFGDSTFSSDENPLAHLYATWGDYSITLRLIGKNCSDSIVEVIKIIPPVPIADFEGPISGCQPVVQQFINNSEYGESYFWNLGDGNTSASEEPLHTYVNPGVYTVSLEVIGEGGKDTLVREQIIEVFEMPVAFFTVNPTSVFLPDDPVHLINLSSFADFYQWDFGDGESSQEESLEYIYQEEGIYNIRLIASTENNCIDTFTIAAAVEAIFEGEVDIPNAFTPSISGVSDGTIDPNNFNNDVFYPLITGAIDYELNIFNKWGELIFISEDVNIGWNGYYKGELCKQDVYIYKMKVQFIDGRTESYVGDVTLLR